jgi:alkylation response protein AidB-like acyl-CoA dehydrogenase
MPSARRRGCAPSWRATTATTHDLWRGLAELGIAGLIVPAEHGGSELEILDLALAAEEMGWAATPGPFLGNSRWRRSH